MRRKTSSVKVFYQIRNTYGDIVQDNITSLEDAKLACVAWQRNGNYRYRPLNIWTKAINERPLFENLMLKQIAR